MSQDLDEFLKVASTAHGITVPNKRFFAGLPTYRAASVRHATMGYGLTIRVNHFLPPDACAFTDASGRIIAMLYGLNLPPVKEL